MMAIESDTEGSRGDHVGVKLNGYIVSHSHAIGILLLNIPLVHQAWPSMPKRAIEACLPQIDGFNDVRVR